MSQLDQDEKLIIEVQQYPGLYDQSSYDYRDLRKKESMWQSVADSVGMHARECQARWRVLRDKFVREMRKNVNPKRAGTGALQVYQGSWPLMSQLMFLTSHVKHRPYRAGRRDTYSDAGATEDEEEAEPSDEEEPDIKHNLTNSIRNPTPPRCPTPPNPKKMKTQLFESDVFKINHADLEQQQQQQQQQQQHQKLPKSYQGALRHEDEENGERLFCLSLVPVLKRLDPEKRSLAKLQIQRVLHNLEFPQVRVEF